jgi:valyl-tRNA synthetase
MTSSWPKKIDVKVSKKEQEGFAKLKELIACVREFKKDLGVLERVDVLVAPKDKKDLEVLGQNCEWLSFVCRSRIVTAKDPAKEYVSTANLNCSISVSKELIKDVQLHKEKIAKKIEELSGHIKTQKAKLANPSFVKRAPAQVVAAAKERVAVCLEEQKRLKSIRW